MKNLYSNERELKQVRLPIPPGMELNSRKVMDGRVFLQKLPADTLPAVFFDPQYRGVLDKMNYGNEGKTRGVARSKLAQMDLKTIFQFIDIISDKLMPSGHLFLWVDKFHLFNTIQDLVQTTMLKVVDMVVWDKGRMGMGYRTRRSSEYCIVMQKLPTRVKGVWTIHNIPDVWLEPVKRDKAYPHKKPIKLQSELIKAVTNPGDIVVDPAAGSYSVMESAVTSDRIFLGCDLK